MIIKYKIEGLFQYCIDSKEYKYKYRNNDNYTNYHDAQKDFLKNEGYNNIINTITTALEKYDSDIKLNVLEKKYLKSDSNKYITIEIDDPNIENYYQMSTRIKEVETLINRELMYMNLYMLNRIAA